MAKNYHVAIVGATGAGGIELLRVLERRDFPVAGLRMISAPRQRGVADPAAAAAALVRLHGGALALTWFGRVV